MTNRTTETIREQTMRNFFDRISCLQATSEYTCGEGLEWHGKEPNIQLHGFITSAGMQELRDEGASMYYDEGIGFRVYDEGIGFMVY